MRKRVLFGMNGEAVKCSVSASTKNSVVYDMDGKTYFWDISMPPQKKKKKKTFILRKLLYHGSSIEFSPFNRIKEIYSDSNDNAIRFLVDYVADSFPNKISVKKRNSLKAGLNDAFFNNNELDKPQSVSNFIYYLPAVVVEDTDRENLIQDLKMLDMKFEDFNSMVGKDDLEFTKYCKRNSKNKILVRDVLNDEQTLRSLKLSYFNNKIKYVLVPGEDGLAGKVNDAYHPLHKWAGRLDFRLVN